MRHSELFATHNFHARNKPNIFMPGIFFLSFHQLSQTGILRLEVPSTEDLLLKGGFLEHLDFLKSQMLRNATIAFLSFC